MAQSPCFLSPLAETPFAPLSNPLYLLGNPPSCDRIRPPRSQVACKLTSPFPTLSPIPPPPNSQNPGYQAPRYDDLKNPASSVRNNYMLLNNIIQVKRWSMKVTLLNFLIKGKPINWYLIDPRKLMYSRSRLSLAICAAMCICIRVQ